MHSKKIKDKIENMFQRIKSKKNNLTKFWVNKTTILK